MYTVRRIVGRLCIHLCVRLRDVSCFSILENRGNRRFNGYWIINFRPISQLSTNVVE